MMKRAHVDELYTAYLDGTLPDTMRQQVDEHLHVCPACARGLEETRQLVADLQLMSAVPVPSEFVAGVRARVQALPTRPARPWLRPVLAWGSLAAAASIALIFSRFSTPPSGTVAQTPRTTATQRIAPATKNAPMVPKSDTMVKPKAPAIAAVPKIAAGRPVPAPRFAVPPTKGMKRHRIQRDETATADIFANTAQQPARIEIAMAPPLPTRAVLSEGFAGVNTRWQRTQAGDPGPAGITATAGMPETPENTTIMSAGAGNTAGPAPAPTTPPATNGTTIMADKAAPLAVPFGVGAAKNDDTSAITPPERMMLMSKAIQSQAVQNTAHGSLTAEVQGSQLLLQVVAKPASQLTLQYADAPTATAQQVLLPATRNEVTVTLPALPDGATLAVAVGQKDAQYVLVVPGRPVEDGDMTTRPMPQTLQALANAANAYLLCPQDFAARPVTPLARGLAPLAALQQLAHDAGYQFEYRPPWVNITR